MENRIRNVIKELGVRANEVAAKLGMTPVALSQIGMVKMPQLETLRKVAKALGVPEWRLVLTEEELQEIRGASTRPDNAFRCPKCGAALKVVPEDYQCYRGGDAC